MWPTHCVQGSTGAEFHKELNYYKDDIVISKGTVDRVDSYSGFGTHPEKTDLEKILKEK